MKPSQDSTKLSRQELPPLRTLQINSGLTCPKCGSNDYRKGGKNRQSSQKYLCKNCSRSFTENSFPAQYSSYLALSEDVWDAAQLGLQINRYEGGRSKLIFCHIQQDWLKVAAKKFIRYMAATKRLKTLIHYLDALNSFSSFLTENYFLTDFTGINRALIVEYISYVSKNKKSFSVKYGLLNRLNTFFKTGIVNNWFDLPPYLILREDYPKETKRLPRNIPEEVMSQLNQHLNTLPAPVMRMTLVLQECGLRIGELCQLPFNCLKKDGEQEWSLQFIRWKMLEETKLPISQELAAVIEEQQQYIRENLSEDYEYLFCGRKHGTLAYKGIFVPASKLMSTDSFAGFLKRLAEEFNLRDNSGKRWNFQTHQFRHTVGTRMVNLGVPLAVIQKYLGHSSPKMTMTYAHLKDETMKKAVAEFRGKMVNVAGQVVDEFGVAASIAEGADPSEVDAAWLRKNILARALPDGLCKRPAAKGKCLYEVNKCHSCADFLADEKYLPQYEYELERALSMIQWAQQNPQSNRAKIVLQDNQAIKNGLENVISGLKADQTRRGK